MANLRLWMAALLSVITGCGHSVLAAAKDECFRRKGFWAESTHNVGGVCYPSLPRDAHVAPRSLGQTRVDKIVELVGAAPLPATLGDVRRWLDSAKIENTCSTERVIYFADEWGVRQGDCKTAAIKMGNASITRRFYFIQMGEQDPHLIALEIESSDPTQLRPLLVKNLGEPAAACIKGHEELWILEGGMIRLGGGKATLFSEGKACP